MGASIEASMKKMTTTFRVAGGAMLAVGAASLKMINDARDMNAQFAQTAITMGLSTQVMRDLALSITSVSTPLGEIQRTFELLARAGVKNAEELKANTLAFDALADATGSTADAVADQLIPVYKAFGLELPKTSADMDKFTWLVKNTGADLSDLAMVVQRLAPEMRRAGISIEDAVDALILLSNRGITGRKATMELSNAITQAAERGVKLKDALFATSDEVKKLTDRQLDMVGSTDKYADAANTQFGLMDQLKQTMSELSLRIGTLLQPFEALSGLMTTLGTALIFLSSSVGIATIKWVANTAALFWNKLALWALPPATIGVATATDIATFSVKGFTAALLMSIKYAAILAAGLVAVTAQLVTEWWAISKLREALGGPKAADNPWEEFLGWLSGISKGLSVVETEITKVIAPLGDMGNAARTAGGGFDAVSKSVSSAGENIEDYLEKMRQVADDEYAAARSLGIDKMIADQKALADANKTMAESWAQVALSLSPVQREFDRLKLTEEDIIVSLALKWGKTIPEVTKMLSDMGIAVGTVRWHLSELGIGVYDVAAAVGESGKVLQEGAISLGNYGSAALKAKRDLIELEAAINASIAAASAREAELTALGISRPTSRAQAEAGPPPMSQAEFDSMWLGFTENAKELLTIAGNEGMTIGKFMRLWGMTDAAAKQYGHTIPLQAGGIAMKPLHALIAEREPEAVIPLSKLGNVGGFKTANIIIQMDGRTLAKVMGQPLVDEIRLRQGMKV